LIRITARQPTADDREQFMERVPLGTPYPVLADRIAAVARAAGATIAVDSTGIGRAVVDLLRERVSKPDRDVSARPR
jgi:hypothetical protein